MITLTLQRSVPVSARADLQSVEHVYRALIPLVPAVCMLMGITFATDEFLDGLRVVVPNRRRFHSVLPHFTEAISIFGHFIRIIEIEANYSAVEKTAMRSSMKCPPPWSRSYLLDFREHQRPLLGI